MASYKNRVQTDNKHLEDLTRAPFVHIDGGTAQITQGSSTSGRTLLRIINNTKGLSLVVRTGSRVVANIGTGTVEGTYNYGVYCENGITVDVGGTGSATLVYDI